MLKETSRKSSAYLIAFYKKLKTSRKREREIEKKEKKLIFNL